MFIKILERILEALFHPEQEKKYPWLKFLWMTGLFLFGVYLWGKFLSWNALELNFYDWGKLNTPRLLFLQNAYKAGQFPLHMADATALLGLTDRFFAIPDVITTPQTLLLLSLDVPTFALVDILISYAIGFLGLLWLRKRFNFSLFAFTVLFFLFTFNGHILAHYSVGHFNWGPYFLLPIVFSHLFRFLDGEYGWRWVAGFSFTIFYMMLAGGWHHVLWMFLFIGVLWLFCRSRSVWLIAAVFFSVVLSAVRLLPPVFEIGKFTAVNTFNMVLGYPSLAEVFESMLFVRRPVLIPTEYTQFNLYGYEKFYWEFNFYLGIIGTAFLVIFGLYSWFRENRPPYPELILPTFTLIALSIGSTFWLVRLSGIPLFGGERVTSRMISLPLVLLMMMATRAFQTWLDGKSLTVWRCLISSGILVLLVLDLYNNLRVWRFSESAAFFGDNMIDLSGSALANHPDPAYTTSLMVGLCITVIAAIFLFVSSLRERQTQVTE